MFGLRRKVLEPLGIERLHEMHKVGKVVASNAVIVGISADRSVADRGFAAERTIEAIEPKGLPCPEIEAVPRLDLCIIRHFRHTDELRLFGVFVRQALQPIALAFLRQTPAEGRSEFFVASSTNSISVCATCCAHHSIAATTCR